VPKIKSDRAGGRALTPHILLVENIHPVAKDRLEEEGFKVELLTHSPSEKELIEMLPDFDVLGIRSKTEITKKILQSSDHLLALGAFCIGTNQIELEKANEIGIPVFNAPYSNTRSVAELVIAEMVSLARQLGDRNSLAHKGEWMKTADGSHEIRGKTLGIVGYGHIGTQVSILAEALGLKVIFYDVVKKLPLGNAQPVNTMGELLRQSDFVTLHVPETKETKDMIAKKELARMKKGSYLINASRGTVVVIEDLVEALKSKQLGGCAIDVFPMEPASNKERFKSPLQGLANVILTPHIGGSTEEAQYAIGLEVAESFTRYLKIGSTSGAVNFPHVELPKPQQTDTAVRRILNVHQNQPGVLGEINSIVSKAGANIMAQYLSTDEQIGYLVMDVEEVNAKVLSQKISELSRSIKTRVVF
jgi:D-3-phosphoglycerate dehydrogenase